MDYFPGKQPDGHPALVVVCKRTYRIDEIEARAVVADEQLPPAMSDELWSGDDSMASSVKSESEIAPYKRRADIVIQGTAYSPGGKPVRSFEVVAKVGRYQKRLMIIGPRHCIWQPPKTEKRGKEKVAVPQPPLFSEPGLVEKVPITYEHAYGGVTVLIPQDLELFRAEQERAVEEQKQEEKRKEEEEKKKQEDEKEAAFEAQVAEFSKKPELDEYFLQAGAEGVRDSDEISGGVGADGVRRLEDKDLEAFRQAEAERFAAEEAARAPKVGPGGIILADSAVDAGEYVAPPLPEQLGETGSGTQVIKIADVDGLSDYDESWVDAAKASIPVKDGNAAERKRDLPDDLPKVYYPYNPVGKGFSVSYDRQILDELPLPLIENPDRPLRPSDIVRDITRLLEPIDPLPFGFGWVGRGWYPRAKYCGVYPEDAENAQDQVDKFACGLDPEDSKQRKMLENMLDYSYPLFDDAWYNGATTEFQVPSLDGDEEILIKNMNKTGTLFCRLPGDMPYVTVDRGKGPEPISLMLDTLCVRTDDLQVILVWRGHLKYSGPDELVDYPYIRLNVVERGIEAYREELYEAAQKKHRENLTQTISVEQVLKLNAEEEAKRQKELADAAKLKSPKYVWTIEDEKGTRVQRLTEPGDVLETDDAWVEETKRAMDDRSEAQKALEAMTERERRKQKKEELRRKLEEIRQRELEEAKKKKK
ncbi:MAG: DUF2169 domain-containing protein [Myxococcales bacterium]|nr:DUF2169 domain-containing protein [Myxococcales bacterium]